MTTLDRAGELMRKVRGILLTEGEAVDFTGVEARVLRMYSRVRSLFEASRILLQSRFAEEAVLLARELFDDSLKLMELATRTQDRSALVLGLASESLRNFGELLDQAQHLGIQTVAEQTEARLVIAERRKKIQDYRQRNSVGKLQRFRDTKELARKHNRLGDYLDFVTAHRFVHVEEMAQATRTQTRGDGVIMFSLYSPNDEFIAAVSCFVMTSALHAQKAAASILGWTGTPTDQVDRTLAEVDALFTGESLTPPPPSPP